MSEKTDHEDQALQGLVKALIASGHDAAVTAHPDLDPAHPLTVDGIVTVDGTDWAVDHCLLSRDDRLPSSLAVGHSKLEEELEAVAKEYDLALVVSFQPQDRALGKALNDAYFRMVVDLARDAASTGEARFSGDGFTSVQIAPNSPVGTVALIGFQTLTGNPSLGAQIQEGIGPALEKKLSKQLKRAKDAGYPVMLLLDQEPRPGSKNGTVWQAAHPNTVLGAVQPVLDRHPGVVDLLWYRPWGGGPVQLLLGAVPSPPPGADA